MRKNFPDVPPVWLAGTMVASWGLGAALPSPSFGAVGHWAGGAMIAGALAAMVWAGVWFWRKKTPIEPHHDPRALIVEGPYRVSRNPIYLALMVVALGFALRQGGIAALLPLPLLFLALDRRFAAPEEAKLRAAFGPEAEDYLARTRRWI
ncbi:methyltransferase family protein [Jannaschia pohangensis]|uniref:Phospholipid methyltransferase n=1 Tax=Jannaschia pohangensis TaxID=390807 RepID=A0A1I3SE14_9RHOB|nr:isoprenylcysteine carboxylmethyltransferase family protein [Jannaschia pohangensis]SFJ56978.1 Phospholipid methyltransferase [Jannaschia pohangensis]